MLSHIHFHPVGEKPKPKHLDFIFFTLTLQKRCVWKENKNGKITKEKYTFHCGPLLNWRGRRRARRRQINCWFELGNKDNFCISLKIRFMQKTENPLWPAAEWWKVINNTTFKTERIEIRSIENDYSALTQPGIKYFR